MATVYRAIVTTGENSVVIKAATPTALGVEIAKLIPVDPRNDVDVCYVVTGPISRRMAE